MDLLEDLRMSLLNFKFIGIHIIHKILVLIINHLNNIFECFFKKYKQTFIFFKIMFSKYIIVESLRFEEENIKKSGYLNFFFFLNVFIIYDNGKFTF